MHLKSIYVEHCYINEKCVFWIFQGIMENPHIAADGYSYEFEAIEEWLQTGHDTSPLTKMKLGHKHLTANHTLRSLIEEWRGLNPNLCS